MPVHLSKENNTCIRLQLIHYQKHVSVFTKKKNKVQKYIFPVCQILIEHLLKINVLQVIASSGKGSSFFQTVKNILFGIQKYKVINFVTLI